MNKFASTLLAFSFSFFSCFSLAAPSANQLTAMSKALEKNPSSTKMRTQYAEALYQAREYQKVIDVLSPYTEQIPIPSFLILAGAYSELKKHEDEVRILKMVSEKDKDNYQSFYILGSAYVQWEKDVSDISRKKEIQTKAIESLRKAIGLNAAYKPSYDLLFNLLIASESNYEARTLLNDMIVKFGSRPRFLNDMCRLLTIDGYLNQAIEDCKKAILASKQFPDNYIYLAQSYFDKGQEKKSERMLKIAAKKFPKSEPVQWAAGEFYQKKKNHPVANRYFAMAVKADSKSNRANISYAQTLVEIGKPQEALPYYIKACKVDPGVRNEIATAAAKLRLEKNFSLAEEYTSAKHRCQ